MLGSKQYPHYILRMQGLSAAFESFIRILLCMCVFEELGLCVLRLTSPGVTYRAGQQAGIGNHPISIGHK